jgi:hypothetical protein
MSDIADKYSIDFSAHLYYDETSPSCIRWKEDRYAGVHGKIKVRCAGEPAGTKSVRDKRWIVSIDKIKYQVSLIVCKILEVNGHNDIGPKVVDHINKDSCDNRVANLRIVDQVYNLRNSGKRKTNKSGKTGVHWTHKKGYKYAVASWVDLSGKIVQRWFSINKYGEQTAFDMAVSSRDAAINSMNSKGAGYTEDHR